MNDDFEIEIGNNSPSINAELNNTQIEIDTEISEDRVYIENDYTRLTNKPSINDVQLLGNKTSDELNLQQKITNENKLDYSLVDNTPTKTSDFINDGEDGTSPFATQDWVTEHEVEGAIDTISKNGTNLPIVNKNVDIPVGTGTLTITQNNTSKGTFNADTNNDSTINIEVPTKTSDLTNDGDGTSNFATLADLPTKTSDLTNDGDGESAFATESYVDTYGGKIDSISVNNVPQTIDANKNVNLSLPVDNALNTSSENPVQNKVIAELIPAQASSSNQLADKQFVNSSVATNTANFLGTYNIVTDLGLTTSATHLEVAAAIETKLQSLSITPTNNDYVFVAYPDTIVSTQYTQFDRYKYNADDTEWGWEYTLNNSSFTANQWAAINSGITSAKVDKLDSLQNDSYYVHKAETETITGTKTFNTNAYFNGSICKNSNINPLITPASTQYNVVYWGYGKDNIALGVSHFAHNSAGDLQHQVDARRIVSVLKAGCTIKSGSTVQGTTYSSDTITTSDINITSTATLKTGSIIVTGSYIRGTLMEVGTTATSNNNVSITTGTAIASDATLNGTTFASLIAGITKDGTGYTNSSHEFRTPSLKFTSSSFPHIKGNNLEEIDLSTGTDWSSSRGLYVFNKAGFWPGSAKNNLEDLGNLTHKWKDLYSGGNLKLYNTSNNRTDAPDPQTYRALQFLDKSGNNIANINGTIGGSWNALNFQLSDKSSPTNTVNIEYVTSGGNYWSIDPVTQTPLVNLGSSSRKWKDIHFGGNAYKYQSSGYDGYRVKNTSYTLGNTPSSDTGLGVFRTEDANGNYAAIFQSSIDTSGTHHLFIGGRQATTAGGSTYKVASLALNSSLTATWLTANSNFEPSSDNALNLGRSSIRWSNLYLGNSININTTSDTTPAKINFYKNGVEQGYIRSSNATNIVSMLYAAPTHYFANIANNVRLIIDTTNKNIRSENTINKFDLGTSSIPFKDLYLSGNLSDGTNSVSVSNIVTANTTQTISGNKTFSGTITVPDVIIY